MPPNNTNKIPSSGMDFRWLLQLLLIFGIFPIQLNSCPHFSPSPHCFCQQPGPSLVCSCSSSATSSGPFSASSKLRLNSRLIPSRLSQLVVHSCRSVSIAAGTFRSKNVLDQIKFLDIGYLHIDSRAFAGIRHSPRLLTIQNVTRIPSIPPLAFAGLGPIQHFWWRNVTIGRVHSRAFAKRIDSGGFGQIPGIGHLFFRGQIQIDWLADGAFEGSKMEELVMENAQLKAKPEALKGLRAKRIRLLNCRWGGRRIGVRQKGGRKIGVRMKPIKEEEEEEDGRDGRRRVRRSHRHQIRIEEILIRNCTIGQMPLMANTMVDSLNVESSTITQWSWTMAEGHRMRISNSRIRHLDAGSMRHWDSVDIHGSRLGAILRPSSSSVSNSSSTLHSISNTSPLSGLRLRIVNSRLRLLSSRAFSGLPLHSLHLINSSISQWRGSPLALAQSINQIWIGHSRLGIQKNGGHEKNGEEGEEEEEDYQGEGPFVGINSISLRIEHSMINGHLGENPFWQTNLSSLAIRHCHFEHSISESIFAGLEVAEQIEFTQNEWTCGENYNQQQQGQPIHCGTEQLLLSSLPRLPHWFIGDNHCNHPSSSPSSSASNSFSSSSPSPIASSNPCTSPIPSASSSPSTVGTLLCRHVGFFQECLCPSDLPASSALPIGIQSPIPLLPMPTVRVLLLSDCPDSIVHLLFNSSSVLSHLYVFRVRQVELGQIPSSLRHLHVLHSTLALESARTFAHSNLAEFNMMGGRLDGHPPPANFDWNRMGRIRLEQTDIGNGEWANALALAQNAIVFTGEESSTRQPQVPLINAEISRGESHRQKQSATMRKRCAASAKDADFCPEGNGQKETAANLPMAFIVLTLLFIFKFQLLNLFQV